MASVGKHIRARRVEPHMTQDDLAAEIFATRQTI